MRTANTARSLLAPLLVLLLVLLLCHFAACSKPHVLNANLTRDNLNSRITSNFHKGMTYKEVNSKLTDLGVSEGMRHTYSPTPPREMLARLLPPGGAWVDQPDQTVEWWDVTFSFDSKDQLTAARALNGGARYIDGFASNINPPLPAGTRIRYPQPVPPPPTAPAGQPIPLH